MSPVQLRLKEWREKKGLTQSALADKSGVKQGTISRMEAGAWGTLNLDHAEKLADALDIKVRDLFKQTSTPAPAKKRGKRG